MNTLRMQGPRWSSGTPTGHAECRGTVGEGNSPLGAAVLSPADTESGTAPFMGGLKPVPMQIFSLCEQAALLTSLVLLGSLTLRSGGSLKVSLDSPSKRRVSL